MTDAFRWPAADFSGIDGTRDLFISKVIHQAIIGVEEDGTEAAAATIIAMACGAAPGYTRPKPIPFVADHPFMFLIMHRPTGSILFMGRVKNPEKQ